MKLNHLRRSVEPSPNLRHGRKVPHPLQSPRLKRAAVVRFLKPQWDPCGELTLGRKGTERRRLAIVKTARKYVKKIGE